MVEFSEQQLLAFRVPLAVSNVHGGSDGAMNFPGGAAQRCSAHEQRLSIAIREVHLQLLVIDLFPACGSLDRQIGRRDLLAVPKYSKARPFVLGGRERCVGMGRKPQQISSMPVTGHMLGVSVVGEPD